LVEERRALDQLRTILLSEHKEELYRINDDLRNEVLDEIQFLKQQMDDPDLFAQKIEQSKGQFIDILGPVMGRLMKKYIQIEIEKINKKLHSGTKNLTSAEYWKSMIFGRKKVIDKPELQEVMLINRDSGLLISKYSKNEISDPDVIAGMFTAIKSFMETALDAKASEVGLIDYGEFKILLQDYGSYYFSVVFTGFNDPVFKEQILERTRLYAEENSLNTRDTLLNGSMQEKIEKQLSKYFEDIWKKL